MEGSEGELRHAEVLQSTTLLQHIRQPGSITARTFEITFHDPGVHVYAFTFG